MSSLLQRLLVSLGSVGSINSIVEALGLYSAELEADLDAEHCAAPLRKQFLVPMLRAYAEIPADAIVYPVQAESAFGCVQATRLDHERSTSLW